MNQTLKIQPVLLLAGCDGCVIAARTCCYDGRPSTVQPDFLPCRCTACTQVSLSSAIDSHIGKRNYWTSLTAVWKFFERKVVYLLKLLNKYSYEFQLCWLWNGNFSTKLTRRNRHLPTLVCHMQTQRPSGVLCGPRRRVYRARFAVGLRGFDPGWKNRDPGWRTSQKCSRGRFLTPIVNYGDQRIASRWQIF